MTCPPQSNNGMHPTRDTLPLINLRLVGGRVMPALGGACNQPSAE